MGLSMALSMGLCMGLSMAPGSFRMVGACGFTRRITCVASEGAQTPEQGLPPKTVVIDLLRGLYVPV